LIILDVRVYIRVILTIVLSNRQCSDKVPIYCRRLLHFDIGIDSCSPVPSDRDHSLPEVH